MLIIVNSNHRKIVHIVKIVDIIGNHLNDFHPYEGILYFVVVK